MPYYERLAATTYLEHGLPLLISGTGDCRGTTTSAISPLRSRMREDVMRSLGDQYAGVSVMP